MADLTEIPTQHAPGQPGGGGEPRDRFPIVAIGSSAGGIRALETFFGALEARDMAIVVVSHLSPGHESSLPELIGRSTELEVREAKHGAEVLPGHVHVGPPGTHLDLRQGRLWLTEVAEGQAPHLPVDHLFRSLAWDAGERAIAIVLSGAGSDGTLGVREIKAASGMVMIQEPDSAEYRSMPHSAESTGTADYVLPPEKMPDALSAYVAGDYLKSRSNGDDGHDASLHRIFVLLRTRTGHDFANYKPTTIRRRIERRMNVHQIGKTEQYVRYLQETPHEIDLLFKELLIGVTSFFRDPDAFESLAEKALPPLLETRPDGHTVRAWVPGCATGEEVYSIAILLRELIDSMKRPFELQVFGTDLDERAIHIARGGQYADGIALDVLPPRLERFFIREDGTFRIRKDVRELTVFAVQNVIKDPPFTKLDLISCRNLLIYLNADLQQKLFPVFHYALKPGGLLFLGPSESIGGFTELFEVVDKRWKIYRRKETTPETLPLLDAPIQTPRLPVPRTETPAPPQPSGTLSGWVDRLLLARFAPASVVVNDRGDVVFIHGRTGDYLEPAPGQPRLNIHEMAREGLRIELAAALRKATTQGTELLQEQVRVRSGEGHLFVDLHVVPITEPEGLRGLILVTFRPRPAPAAVEPSGETEPAPSGETDRLERELQYTKESLQTTIEELETSNEELKSTNEELQSTNEELQSANEELETSKEEMQSLNEELTTVNAELSSKVDALSRANDDMQNLLNSTEIATIFLDRDLHISRYTEQAKKLVSLIHTDLGRPLGHLVSCLNYDELIDDCREVLRTLACKQTEVQDREGRWFLARIMPYRTAGNVIDGLVLTFVDISRVKSTERELAAAKDRLEADVEAMARMQAIGTHFVRGSGLDAILEEVLDAAIAITDADMGDLQLSDDTGRLRIRASRGFKQDWDRFWDVAPSLFGSCEAALHKGHRVIVKDVEDSEHFDDEECRKVLRRAGVRAVQSTPLFGRGARLLGMISTHYHQPTRADERSLRLLDLLARQTSEILERTEAEADPPS
ncbi:chemotaxis protein CheB [Haloferula sargassicola]|uniref:protein-glutamate O-methyltransferase n=1 Tax=Haloferula sargassicola TaxID=490096 RepID=A0ABP9UMH0_9BACT